MKMRTKDYDHLVKAIAPWGSCIIRHRAWLTGEARSKPFDIEMRLRWDLLRAAGLTSWTLSLYHYLNDKNIDVALRKAMKDMEASL